MKPALALVSSLALGLAACGTLRASEQVDSGAAARDCAGECVGQVCPATIECTGQGTCIIRWGTGDQRGEVELRCDGETCEVVRCDAPEDCRSKCSMR